MKFKFLKATLLGTMLSVCDLANAGLIFTIDRISDTQVSIIGIGSLEGVSVFGGNIISLNNIFDDNTTGDSPLSILGASTLALDNIGINGVYIVGTGLTPIMFGSTNASIYMTTATSLSNGSTLNDGTLLLDITSTGINNKKWSAAGTSGSVAWGWFGGQINQGSWTMVDSSINTAVPEPSTLAIFVLAIMGLTVRRFKKTLKCSL